MNNILEYKGYIAKIEYSAADGVLYGKIEGIKDLVNFESETAAGIEQEFHSAVDDYLALCAELGQEPDKAYSGTFNVRVSPVLHRSLAMLAAKNGTTLNAEVEKALSKYTNQTEGKGMQGTVNLFVYTAYTADAPKGRIKTDASLYDDVRSVWRKENAYAGGKYNA